MTLLADRPATDTRDDLAGPRWDRYRLTTLENRTPAAFRDDVRRAVASVDAAPEGYLSAAHQRDLSIRSHWGHAHDFGDGFRLDGRMRFRHIDPLAEYIDA
jgi:hypothetical protein